MCGIFGFITSKGKGPDIARLRHLAVITQSRGEHAFGMAWLDEGGRIQTFKRPGSAGTHLKALDCCQDAVVMIGHCRYATHGSPADNRNNHPHVAGAGFLVHNGVVGNYHQVVRSYRLEVQSQCDSEIFGLLMARCGGSIAQRLAWAAGQAQGDLAVLGVWRAPARILVGRRGRPLHFGQGREGYYFASLPQGLPGRVQAAGNHTARVLTYENGALSLDGAAVRLAAQGADNHGDEQLRWLGD